MCIFKQVISMKLLFQSIKILQVCYKRSIDIRILFECLQYVHWFNTLITIYLTSGNAQTILCILCIKEWLWKSFAYYLYINVCAHTHTNISKIWTILYNLCMETWNRTHFTYFYIHKHTLAHKNTSMCVCVCVCKFKK